MQVFGVATDSSFVDFGEVVVEQGAAVLPVPSWLFGPVRVVMRLGTGRWPVDLEASPIDRSIPMLHIHGDADQAIDVSNLTRLATITGGETLTVASADHIESLTTDRPRYSDAVLHFLCRALTQFDDRSPPTQPA